MRRRIEKGTSGRGARSNREVKLNVIKSGKYADGSQRFAVSIRFAENAHTKASNTGYVVIDLDDETNRLYFVPSNSNKGYMMTSPDKKSKCKGITFPTRNTEEWEKLNGEYDFKKDVSDGTYYIDVPFCPQLDD